jgi:hypothetical protein
MLLDLLTKDEKHLFLDLAAHMTKADGTILESESLELKIMTNEMGKDAKGHDASNPDEAVVKLGKSSVKIQRIILLNLIVLSLSDDFYHTEEHLVIEELLETWNISAKKKAELFKLVYNYKDLREKAKLVVSA